MEQSIELARQVAAVLTRLVKGRVHLVFFDTSPRHLDVTGRSLEALRLTTATIHAGGGTSIGCGLQYALDNKMGVDGIAIVSDGAENTFPMFAQVYQNYVKRMDREPTVYWYRAAPDKDPRTPIWITQWQRSHQAIGLDVQEFDVRSADYYSLPNLVQTMRIGRYQLLDEVLSTSLRTVDEVLQRTKGQEVLRHARTTQAVGS